jgi:hypothetical protein
MLAGLSGLVGLLGIATNQRFRWFPWQTIQTTSGVYSSISKVLGHSRMNIRSRG